MNSRIAAVLSGLATATLGFAWGAIVARHSDSIQLEIACDEVDDIPSESIPCAAIGGEHASFLQPADQALRSRLNDAMLALETDGRLPAFIAVPQLDKVAIPPLPAAAPELLAPSLHYEHLLHATVMIHTGYKCDRCENWHGGVATGFIVHPDGWVMTAGHVFKDIEANRHLSVMLHDETLYPIEGVALIDTEADFALIKIPASELTCLTLAAADPVPGTPVTVLSHPHGHFYVLTKGVVSRVLDESASASDRLQITAPFAVGSSGAAVVDDCCQLVGLALSTETIYADPQEQKNPQLVIPTCVPTSAIRAAIESR